jgi:hypothetical protein
MIPKISLSQWYLVHSDKRPQGWVFCIVLLPFKSAAGARIYAREHGLADHVAWRGERVKDLDPRGVEIVRPESTVG